MSEPEEVRAVAITFRCRTRDVRPETRLGGALQVLFEAVRDTEGADAWMQERLFWPSTHWGTEQVSPEAWPHIAIAAAAAARAEVEKSLEALLRSEMMADPERAGERWGLRQAIKVIRGQA
jgi:hypothetical protein